MLFTSLWQCGDLIEAVTNLPFPIQKFDIRFSWGHNLGTKSLVAYPGPCPKSVYIYENISCGIYSQTISLPMSDIFFNECYHLKIARVSHIALSTARGDTCQAILHWIFLPQPAKENLNWNTNSLILDVSNFLILARRSFFFTTWARVRSLEVWKF